MKENEKLDIIDLVEKVSKMDNAGRTAVKVAVDVLYARSQFKEAEENERRQEKRDSTECLETLSEDKPKDGEEVS